MIWQKCLKTLEQECSLREFNTYLKPLKDEIQADELVLLAPKKYIVDKINQKFIFRIKALIVQTGDKTVSSVSVKQEITPMKDIDSSIVTFFSELIGRIINFIHH